MHHNIVSKHTCRVDNKGNDQCGDIATVDYKDQSYILSLYADPPGSQS